MALNTVVRRRVVAGLATAALLSACGGDGGPRAPLPPVGPTPSSRAVTVASGLEHPWGLAFLPDGRMLVTERPGRMRIVNADGMVSAPLAGVPALHAAGQGGLLDVAIDPDFALCPALERAALRSKAYLEQDQNTELADLAYTLQTGRRGFGHRRTLVRRSRADAIALLQSGDPKRVHQASNQPSGIGVGFMFPGQGAQYVHMCRALYESEPRFREEIDTCAAVLSSLLGADLRDILYPATERSVAAQAEITQTAITQPALFAIEYALAQLWLSWGIKPRALIGHSVGEHVAACVGGTFARDNALALLAKCARLMQEMPSGVMRAVRASAEKLQGDLGPRTAMAALNAPNLTVVSGDHEAIAELAAALGAKGVASRLLPTLHAFRLPMMEPIITPFIELVKSTPRQTPMLPWVSSLTGKTITDAEAVDPLYWARQLREPVRFVAGVGQLINPELALVEVGPGQALTSLARQHGERNAEQLTVTLNPAQNYAADVEYLLAAAGQPWTRGVALDWQRLAGRAKYMDALDGGAWQYGDDSAPELGVTFFAGTFVRHPLALTAARAVLTHLKEHGSDLQRSLNLRTTQFAERLSQAAKALGAPIQITHFSSWFYINFPADLPLAGVFFASMRGKGMHIWEGRPCFLTLAHSDAELEHVLNAFKSTIAEMQAATFLPQPLVEARSSATLPPGARKGCDPASKAAWFVPDPARPGRSLQLDEPVVEHG